MLLIESQYLPPIHLFYVLLAQKMPELCLEVHENFDKPGYRNRCHILTADGVQALSIPLVGGRNHKKNLRTAHIDYTQPWLRKHWHALVSAYNNAPYFEHYEHLFAPLYAQKTHETLLGFNTALLQICMEIMCVKPLISHTQSYQTHHPNTVDLRNALLPNRTPPPPHARAYLQVFADRQPFAPNLSIIDLIFSEGAQTKNFLKSE